jgi:hypothetical protein
MLHRYLAGCFLASSLFAAAPSHAATRAAPADAKSDIRLAGAICGWGSRLDVTGLCVDVMDYSRRCSPGSFAMSFPNGNGFRCVPGEWQSAPGWFSDLLGLRD